MSKGHLGLVGSATGVGFPTISRSELQQRRRRCATASASSTADHQTTDLASVTGQSGPGFTASTPTRPALRSSRMSTAIENLQGAEGVYAFSGAQTAIPFLSTTTVGTGSASGSIGSGYASFLLGAVNSLRSTRRRPRSSAELPKACISRTTSR